MIIGGSLVQGGVAATHPRGHTLNNNAHYSSTTKQAGKRGLCRIQAFDLCGIGAVLYQLRTELTSQLGVYPPPHIHAHTHALPFHTTMDCYHARCIL